LTTSNQLIGYTCQAYNGVDIVAFVNNYLKNAIGLCKHFPKHFLFAVSLCGVYFLISGCLSKFNFCLFAYFQLFSVVLTRPVFAVFLQNALHPTFRPSLCLVPRSSCLRHGVYKLHVKCSF